MAATPKSWSLARVTRCLLRNRSTTLIATWSVKLLKNLMLATSANQSIRMYLHTETHISDNPFQECTTDTQINNYTSTLPIRPTSILNFVSHYIISAAASQPENKHFSVRFSLPTRYVTLKWSNVAHVKNFAECTVHTSLSLWFSLRPC